MYNINSHINVNFFQKTTGRGRERSASNYINIGINSNYLLRYLYQKYMKIRHCIELYQSPAASLFQCIFEW